MILRTPDGRRVEVEAFLADGAVHVRLDDGEVQVIPARRLADGALRLELPGGPRTVHTLVTADRVAVSLGGAAVELARLSEAAGAADDADDADVAVAPMPGKVVEVHVAAGDAVEAGQPVVVLEAMKLNNAVEAPRAGVVASVEVAVGDQVAPGDALVRLAVEEERV